MGGNLGWGAVVLMMLGAQWYILFNVAAGAQSIPADMLSCADVFKIGELESMAVFHSSSDLSVSGHRLDHFGGRRVECEHRRRIRPARWSEV